MKRKSQPEVSAFRHDVRPAQPVDSASSAARHAIILMKPWRDSYSDPESGISRLQLQLHRLHQHVQGL